MRSGRLIPTHASARRCSRCGFQPERSRDPRPARGTAIWTGTLWHLLEVWLLHRARPAIAHLSTVPPAWWPSAGRERAEDVVGIGRGLVVLRMALGEGVEARDSAVGEVGASADALASAATHAGRAADGLVAGDGAAGDSERRLAVVVDAAADAVVAIGTYFSGATHR